MAGERECVAYRAVPSSLLFELGKLACISILASSKGKISMLPFIHRSIETSRALGHEIRTFKAITTHLEGRSPSALEIGFYQNPSAHHCVEQSVCLGPSVALVLR